MGQASPTRFLIYDVDYCGIMQLMGNLAFIDGQNLHLGTTKSGWKIDFKRFRVYLKEKYKVDEACYFLGFVVEEQNDLYVKLQKAGYILLFREHSSQMMGKKKGNVDSDIVFETMRRLLDEPDEFEKIVLVSGDGDYKKLVDYLVKKDRLLKILFPNKKFSSSLYNKLGGALIDSIDRPDIQNIIEFKQRKSP